MANSRIKEEIKLKLVEYFNQRSDIDAVILYGSFAKETFNDRSDVDIAVHTPAPLSFDALSEIRVALSLLCSREIDVADLSKAERIFLYQIMTTGERIKFNHEVFHKYSMKALYFYEDYLPIIRACRKEKMQRITEGTF
ncbi:MAG: nucleotidyltransferase domain-containing protein [Fibrobacter sp.]|nr:nucleotidyltransferase domain-containing protein [Fibrobacter sp.]